MNATKWYPLGEDPNYWNFSFDVPRDATGCKIERSTGIGGQQFVRVVWTYEKRD